MLELKNLRGTKGKKREKWEKRQKCNENGKIKVEKEKLVKSKGKKNLIFFTDQGCQAKNDRPLGTERGSYFFAE
jgi:hypothetical protein